MTRRATVELFFSRYGENISLNGVNVSALIRPLSYKSGAKLNLPAEFYDDLHYLYMGPVSEKLTVGGTITCGSRDYAVKRTDTVVIGGEEIYVWAVINPQAPDADKEVTIESGGAKTAVADSYTVKDTADVSAVTSFGESAPNAITDGSDSYLIELTNVIPESGTDLNTLADFSVIIGRKGYNIVYSGCRTKNITETGGASNRAKTNMEILAACRKNEKVSE